MRRLIRRRLEDIQAKQMLCGEFKKGDTVAIDIADDTVTFTCTAECVVELLASAT